MIHSLKIQTIPVALFNVIRPEEEGFFQIQAGKKGIKPPVVFAQAGRPLAASIPASDGVIALDLFKNVADNFPVYQVVRL